MKYRLDIQGLRAIAVLSVFLFHLNKDIMPGGFLGVDIFFVISGFLMSSIVFRQKEKKSFSFKDFYISRIKRIVPACYVMILASTIAVGFIYLYPDALQFRRAAMSAVLFVSNMYFSTLDTYFGTAVTENPLLHTWTLAIEMQFYLFLPLAIILFSRKNIKYIVIGTGLILIAYCQYNLMINSNHDQMYYSFLTRVPEFLVGVLINFLSLKTKRYFKNNNNIYSFIGIILIILSFVFINETSLFPGLIALMPCIGVCFLILSENSVINKIISHKFSVYIGEISYSLYLWHWPVLAILRYYSNGYYFSILNTFISCVLIIIFSILSYYFIEKPLRKISLNKLIISLGCIVCLLGISAFSLPKVSLKNQFPPRYALPAGLGLENHADHVKQRGSIITLGDVSSQDTILLIGDSHGLVYKVYFDKIGKHGNFALQSVTNDSYPPIYGIDKKEFKNIKEYSQYEYLVDIVGENIKSKKIILFCMYWKNVYRFTNLPFIIEEFIKSLSIDQQIVFVEDFPVSEINPLRKYWDLTKVKDKKYIFPLKTHAIPESIKYVLSKYSNTHILSIDYGDFYKEAPFYQDTLMYYDAAHLNRYAMEKLVQVSGINTLKIINEISKKESLINK